MLGLIWRVHVPLAKPTILAFGLVSVSNHWTTFTWPLIVTSLVETRILTVGLSILSATESGTQAPVITAATLVTSGPLLIAFLLFQRRLVQSFMRADFSWPHHRRAHDASASGRSPHPRQP